MPKATRGRLYSVATPIGNLGDLSPRAMSILGEVDVIAAEDTRVFLRLAKELNLKFKAKLVSYHDKKEIEEAKNLVNLILEGKSVALVSDAGTPNINDPGYRLLNLAFENEIDVVSLPGPSSVTAALSICPLPGVNFCFYGFPPSTESHRKNLFSEINFDGRVVFFESPHRIKEHLRDALEVWGDKRVFIIREISKKFEEKSVRTLSEWKEHFDNTPPKGEFVLIYEAIFKKDSQPDLDLWLQTQIDAGQDRREILKEAQSLFNIGRKEIYNKITDLKEKKK